MNSHVSLNSMGVLLVSVRFFYVVFDTALVSLSNNELTKTRGIVKSRNRSNGECYAASQAKRRDFGPSWPEVWQGLGLAPTSGIFQVSAEAGTWKIRKCIDTCIACHLAQARCALLFKLNTGWIFCLTLTPCRSLYLKHRR